MKKVICPNCASEKVKPTGNSWNEGGDMKNDGTYSLPIVPEYRCNDCDKKFTIPGSGEMRLDCL
ncbi:hypothetical protein KGQ34_00915 [Patescibacteria group bacterium]|nr:hypothetical protein [Patescibacteria group bacterium]